jgi:hypothetical protein
MVENESKTHDTEECTLFVQEVLVVVGCDLTILEHSL